MNELKFKEDKRFQKEFNKNKKRCSSLEKDMDRFKLVLKEDIKSNNNMVPSNIKKYSLIQEIHHKYNSYNAKRFRCKNGGYGAGHSPFRIVFIHVHDENIIHFTELFFKKRNKDIPNFQRIEEILATEYSNN